MASLNNSSRPYRSPQYNIDPDEYIRNLKGNPNNPNYPPYNQNNNNNITPNQSKDPKDSNYNTPSPFEKPKEQKNAYVNPAQNSPEKYFQQSNHYVPHASTRYPVNPYPQPCVFHNGQYITNFCCQQQCIMPLCPECIILHLEMHEKNREFAKIVTLDKALGDCLHLVDDIQQQYEENMYKVMDFKAKRQDLGGFIQQKIENSKRKIISLVESYFKELENEALALAQNEDYSRVSYELQMADRFTEQKQNELASMKEQLQGPQFIKYVVRMYSSTYINENANANRECEQYLNILGKQFLDVGIDQSTLYNFNIMLGQYSFLKNAEFYQPPNQINQQNDRSTFFTPQNPYTNSIIRNPRSISPVQMNQNYYQRPLFAGQPFEGNPYMNQDQSVDFYQNPSSYGQKPQINSSVINNNSLYHHRSQSGFSNKQYN